MVQHADLDHAGAELSYVEFTAPVSITGNSEAAATTVVTAASIVLDGSTAIVIDVFARAWEADASAATNLINATLYDDTGGGAASIGILAQKRAVAAASNLEPVRLTRRLTPSAATHTFSWRCFVTNTTTGSVSAGVGGAAAAMPGFIRITRA